MLTTSDAESDIDRSYEQQIRCYIIKPVSLEQVNKVVHAIEDLWLAVVKYPGRS